MTHLFTCGVTQFKAIKNGDLSFEIHNANICEGDRIIWQEIDENNAPTKQEYESIVTLILNSPGVKKGYIAFQFKEKE